MRLFGFDITRTTKQTPVPTQPLSWSNQWWWPVVREPYSGAWQQNMEVRAENLLSFSAVYACITLIAGDISKMRIKLVEQTNAKYDIWTEFFSPAFSPVLTKPNRYQTRVKFLEQWMTSKLIHGNTYVLKARDQRGLVTSMYVLDPMRTKVLVAEDGSVFYQLNKDNLAQVSEEEATLAVPASEIIHDTMNALWHPLCGISPLMACYLATTQGLAIQNNSSKFFQNGSKPGGILTSPHEIDDAAAKRLKDYWDQNYMGNNAGRIAVLGGGLKYENMTMTAEDSQLLEQLKWTAEQICSVFHVPPYKIGAAPPPAYNNIEALQQEYYQTCLQVPIENLEILLDEGLGLTNVVGETYGTELDLDALLRMDTSTRSKTWGDLVQRGIASPDEGRSQFNLAPTPGGHTPYMQQQQFGLDALAERDANDPFPKPTDPVAPDDEDVEDDDNEANDDEPTGEDVTRQLEQWLDHFADTANSH